MMSSAEMLAVLTETTLASSAAIVLVLLLRRPVRRCLGASAAYLLWLVLPAALLAVLLPGPQITAVPMRVVGATAQVGEVVAATVGFSSAWPQWLLSAWLAGAVLMAARLVRQQHDFRRELGVLAQRADGLWQAQSTAGLPAAMGLLQPRIVLPAGFEQRYSSLEQQLVLLHERVHLRRGDIVVNALLALLQCVYWFNPLLLLAQRRCREDQELSCDERVIAQMAGARRSYGDAMLKTGLAQSSLPVGCHWQSHHPLKERIAMLKRPVPGKKQWAAMLLLSVGLSSGFAYAAWAAQPVRAAASAVQGTVYATFVEAELDGTTQRFELRQPAGMPFSFSASSGRGVQWAAEFTLEPGADGLLKLQGTMKADGVVVSSPMLLTKANEVAGIEVSTADGRSLWKLQLRSLPQAAVPVAAGRISVEPEAIAGAAVVDRMPPPRYPKDAVDNRIEGKVMLRIEVGADGRPTDVKVTESQPQGVFDAAAVESAWKWTFVPAQKDGKAVASALKVPVQFAMDEEELTYTEQGS